MTHTTKKRSAFRNGILAVALVLGITLSNIAMATPASAHPQGNIYNNSDHGMWFRSATDGQLKWVPAKTWSSAVGVVASGVFIGKGYCARVYQSDNRGGWAYTLQVRGLSQVTLYSGYEWLVYEWRC